MTASSNDNRQGGCPICGNAAAATHKPFCSARCADIDLGKWLGGNYALPSSEPLTEADIETIVEAKMREDAEEDGR